MRRPILDVERLLMLCGATLALTTSVSHAAGGTLRMAWDHCVADGGVSNKSFACDSNSGESLLVLSFTPPTGGVTAVEGAEAFGNIWADHVANLPSWWGTCRLVAPTD